MWSFQRLIEKCLLQSLMKRHSIHKRRAYARLEFTPNQWEAIERVFSVGVNSITNHQTERGAQYGNGQSTISSHHEWHIILNPAANGSIVQQRLNRSVVRVIRSFLKFIYHKCYVFNLSWFKWIFLLGQTTWRAQVSRSPFTICKML